MRVFRYVALAVIFFLIWSGPIFAAPPVAPTDAGQLLREQEPQRQIPQRMPEQQETVEHPVLTDTGVKVTVKDFRFTGFGNLATHDELYPLVSNAVGKELSFQELQALADKVTDYLKKKGYFLARAYLPKQDITDGIIEIAVLQGRLESQPQILRDKDVRIRESVPMNILQGALPIDEPLQERQLERSILLLNDLPGISAKSFLDAGSTLGSTKLTVNMDEGRLISGAIWGDNYGNHWTGDWRGNGMFFLNDPFRIGDQLSLQATGSEGVYQGRVGYSLPLGSQGLRANVAVGYMDYKVDDSLSPLDAKGDALTANLGFSYPIIRSRTDNLMATLGYEYDKFEDDLLGAQIDGKQKHSATAGLVWDFYDRFLGGGYSSVKLTGTEGYLDLSGVESYELADSYGPQTNGSFTRFNVSLNRLQRVMNNVTLNLSYSGQFALNNLDSSEKFILGGPYGVRAYPVGEAPCDEGHLLSAELRYSMEMPVVGTFQIFGFYDGAYATLHHNLWPNAVTTATGENSYWLSGAGGGVSLNRSGLYALNVMYAQQIDSNPGRDLEGNNADGRSDTGHFWLTANIYF